MTQALPEPVRTLQVRLAANAPGWLLEHVRAGVSARRGHSTAVDASAAQEAVLRADPLLVVTPAELEPAGAGEPDPTGTDQAGLRRSDFSPTCRVETRPTQTNSGVPPAQTNSGALPAQPRPAAGTAPRSKKPPASQP